MPIARTVEERAGQILRWCQAKWPTPYPVKLKWRKELLDLTQPRKEDQPYHGETWFIGRELHIYMSRKMNRTYSAMVDTILHEFAHCRDWRHARLEAELEAKGIRKTHGPEWSLYYGEIYRAYHDEEGCIDSREY